MLHLLHAIVTQSIQEADDHGIEALTPELKSLKARLDRHEQVKAPTDVGYDKCLREELFDFAGERNMTTRDTY